jgi:hypothetical protein
MDRGRVGEDRGSKETDGCPLTEVVNPTRNPHGTCLALVQTLRETFPPTN